MEMLGYAAIVTAINIALLAALGYVYLSNYMKLRSRFALGLAFFASMFLIQNAFALYCQLMMVEYYTPEVSQISLVLNTLEAIGLAALAYISWR